MREFFTAASWRGVWFYFWHPDVPAGGYIPPSKPTGQGPYVLSARRPCRYCPDPLCPEDCPECGGAIHDLDAVPVASRCPSCEHEVSIHADDGCWFTVTHGRFDANAVCQCRVPRGEVHDGEPEPCRRCEHDEQTRGVVQLSTFELYPPDHAPWCQEGR